MRPALIFIIGTIAQLYLLVMLLRFWLPWLQADFRNPIAQGILRLTSPLIIPVRRVVPPIGRLDTATIIVAFGLQYLTVLVILTISGIAPDILPIAITSLIDLVLLSLRLFTFAIFIHIILSWIAPGTYNPATAFIAMLVEPVMRPFRSLIRPIGGLDISPIFAIIALQAVAIYIVTLRPYPI
ncbi:MAG: YggT family protein [Gammaproteobacteria bacterium]|jgi:YggT family protein|nr:YggT family protein [Gammaproteobacteria bacterium]MDH3751018.1 YggT family protein [Gammaproteobacteria bacterium]MDH3804815.1 YggT family protein [Gammaproteobacteria bacterium]